jgi:ABC-type polysaccharide/polyol phosphate transport system ATPase subunit
VSNTHTHTPLISVRNVHMSFWQNNVGVHSVKDLLTMRKNPFKAKTILEDISFDIWPGESLGILGRNGSGKSTLLRIIAGILRPQRGQVSIRGTIAPILAIGAGLELELTGYENIKLLLAIHGLPASQDIITEIKNFSELDHQTLSMPVKCYSSGMIARLAFSISFSNNCDILIIDEVLAVGDQGFQAKCLHKIFEIKKTGKSIIFVSHFPDEVNKICNKALLLENGKIIHSGNVSEVCNQYSQLF